MGSPTVEPRFYVVDKVEDPAGVPRMALTLNGKWLQYKKF